MQSNQPKQDTDAKRHQDQLDNEKQQNLNRITELAQQTINDMFSKTMFSKSMFSSGDLPKSTRSDKKS